jgi:O-antigen/teichoic acid export membrane protein
MDIAMADGTRSSIVQTAVRTFTVRVAVALLGVGISILIARGLGPEGRGMYAYPTVLAGLLMTILHLSLGQANVHVFSRDNSALPDLAANSSFMALVASGVGLVVVLLLIVFRPAGMANVPSSILLIALGVVPFTLHQTYMTGLLQLAHRITATNRVALIAAVTQILAVGLLFVAGRLTVLAVVMVASGVGILQWVLTTGALRRFADLTPRYLPGLFRRSLQFGVRMHIGMVMVSLQLRADVLLLQQLSGFEAVGLYTLAVTIAESLWMLTDSVAVAYLPHQAETSGLRAGRITLQACKLNLYVAFLTATGLALVCFPLVRLAYGKAFLPSVPALLCLLPGVALYSTQRACGAYLLRLNHPLRMSAILSVAVILNLGLNLLWIPRWGITGAALASTVSYCLSSALFLTWTIRLSGVGAREAFILSWEEVRTIRDDLAVLPGRGFRWWKRDTTSQRM